MLIEGPAPLGQGRHDLRLVYEEGRVEAAALQVLRPPACPAAVLWTAAVGTPPSSPRTAPATYRRLTRAAL